MSPSTPKRPHEAGDTDEGDFTRGEDGESLCPKRHQLELPTWGAWSRASSRSSGSRSRWPLVHVQHLNPDGPNFTQDMDEGIRSHLGPDILLPSLPAPQLPTNQSSVLTDRSLTYEALDERVCFGMVCVTSAPFVARIQWRLGA